MANLRNFTRRLFIILNIVAVVLFLLACANPFLHPGKWWFISLLGLSFPFLLFALGCFFILAFFISSHRILSLLSVITLLVVWSHIHSFLALRPASRFI